MVPIPRLQNRMQKDARLCAMEALEKSCDPKAAIPGFDSEHPNSPFKPV